VKRVLEAVYALLASKAAALLLLKLECPFFQGHIEGALSSRMGEK